MSAAKAIADLLRPVVAGRLDSRADLVNIAVRVSQAIELLDQLADAEDLHKRFDHLDDRLRRIDSALYLAAGLWVIDSRDAEADADERTGALLDQLDNEKAFADVLVGMLRRQVGDVADDLRLVSVGMHADEDVDHELHQVPLNKVLARLDHIAKGTKRAAGDDGSSPDGGKP